MSQPATDTGQDGIGSYESEVRRARASFVEDCPVLLDAARAAVAGLATGPANPSALQEVRAVAHRLAGVASLVGFPTVAALAAELEQRIAAGETAFPVSDHDLSALTLAFHEEHLIAPDWIPALDPSLGSAALLLVEDDESQRRVLSAAFKDMGLSVIAVGSAARALDVARHEAISAALVDVDLPDMNGCELTERLKALPGLAEIPILCLSADHSPAQRTRGLLAGAHEYLGKPIYLRELQVRLKLLLARRAAHPAAPDVAKASLPVDFFRHSASVALASSPAALGLVRLPVGARDAAVSILIDDSRKADLVGRVDDAHAAVLLPGIPAPVALRRVTDLVEAIRHRTGQEAWAGVVVATAGSEVDRLLAEADQALAEARYLDRPAALRALDRPRTAAKGPAVLIVEDDPEVVRLVDAHLRGAGYATLVAVSADEAVRLVAETAPQVVLLDLMMPGRSGFEVLVELRKLPGDSRPAVVVLSARNREEDVVRAFELGAHDYVPKPFAPRELLARVARLVGIS
jgi:DNA-binding response OmpR family regulator/GGDEF domain-containing protein